MADAIITNSDNGSVIIEGQADRFATFTAPASVVPSGTLLALDSATLKYIPFVKGGATNDNGIPKAVLTYDVDGGAGGDVEITAFIEGKVNKTRCIIAADGDDRNIDAAVLAQLQDFGIVAVPVSQLNILDNQ